MTARFDTIALTRRRPGPGAISGVRGEPPPPTLKVSLNSIGGFRNAMTFVLTGLDIEAKADLVRRQLEAALTVKPAELEWTLARTDHPDADTEQTASALLHCVVRDPDPKTVGRQFSSAAVELALASYPGLHHHRAAGRRPGLRRVHRRATCRPTEVAARRGARRRHPGTDIPPADADPGAGPGRTRPRCPNRRRPGRPGGCRWARSPAPAAATRAAAPTSVCGSAPTTSGAGWPTPSPSTSCANCCPRPADLPVTRHLLPNLRAVNFVIDGILGEGVAYQARFDPQAKGLGEWLRSRHVDIPETILS